MSGFWSRVEQICWRVFQYLTRKKSTGLGVMKLGASMMAPATLGFILKVSANAHPIINELSLVFTSADTLTTVLFCIGFITLLFGGYLVWMERVRRENQIAIAVELRGLRNLSGNPLHKALEQISGQRHISVLVDLTSPYSDGLINNPNAALDLLLSSLPGRLQAETMDRSRSDVEVYFAGLAPVPFTVLAGQLLDDERSVEFVDWDRRKKCWRQLDEFDDGKRLEMLRMDPIDGHDELCFVVSLSYRADLDGCERSFPGLPIHYWALQELGTDVHWSEHKQIAIASQFIDEMVSLSGTSIKRVHLILAGPSSLVCRIGTHIENRNWPEIIVYQYERDQELCYPWGIKIPMRGERASIVQRRK